MLFDAVFDGDLETAPELARRAEERGFDCLWVPESKHDPFLSLLRAAEGSQKLGLGTAIAVALARNPMSMAYPAWDLQRFSQGRLWLGLGSQVKAHITRRFSMPWDKPIEQMRDYIAALRAIFHAFQSGEPLRYEGTHYRHTLMTPFFNPGPIAHPSIPIGVAAVGPKMSELAGEAADFLSGHPFTNRAYVEKVTLPSMQAGLRKAGRERNQVQVLGNVFVITGDEATQKLLERRVRESIAFYGSTPAYAEVLEVIGHGELHRELHRLSREGRWAEMAKLIPEDVVACCSVRAAPEKIQDEVQRLYGDLYDRVVLAPCGIES
ncbi:TIGR03617 family F420-dependent LLM class oxidoreductase [bacterium CPR1]|nr:TIGR03617 family F420-dependent LLM class oxidoreductase [bacterium CPR1]